MIQKTESQEIDGVISVYYRLSNIPDTKKMLGRFNNLLHEKGIRDELPKGIIGKNPDAKPFDRKSIKSQGVNINIIKSEHYYHLIAVYKKELRDLVKGCLKKAIDPKSKL